MVGAVLRVALAVGMLVVLLTAQLGRHDDWFPLGMLGQYAQPRDPDGTVLDTFAEVLLTDGTRAPVELTVDALGIARVELELALPALKRDPGPLRDLAAAYERGHPGATVQEVVVRQRVHTLADGARDGSPQVRDLVTWRRP